jgi:hypothetical protein
MQRFLAKNAAVAFFVERKLEKENRRRKVVVEKRVTSEGR